jgi:hypothetical protein
MGDVIPFKRRREHPVIEHLKRIGGPITRERVIDFNWPDGKPDPWEADHEADLPEEFQDWSWLERSQASMTARDIANTAMAAMLAFLTVSFGVMIAVNVGVELNGLQQALTVYGVWVPCIVTWAVMVVSHLIAIG